VRAEVALTVLVGKGAVVLATPTVEMTVPELRTMVLLDVTAVAS